MEIYAITNPQAANAIRLANASRFAPRATITHQLQATKTPRSLYVLACVLAAASRA